MALRGDAQVRYVNLIPMFLHTHQAILRLDISVDDILLQTANELVSEHRHCFERELAITQIEQVFQTWAQEVKPHGVEFTFHLISVDS